MPARCATRARFTATQSPERIGRVDRAQLDRYELLGRTLIWAAAVVLALALIGAIAIATSDTTLPFAQDVERQGRGILAIAAIGGGIASSGVLAGLGAILSMLVAARRDGIEGEE